MCSWFAPLLVKPTVEPRGTGRFVHLDYADILSQIEGQTFTNKDAASAWEVTPNVASSRLYLMKRDGLIVIDSYRVWRKV